MALIVEIFMSIVAVSNATESNKVRLFYSLSLSRFYDLN